MKRIVRFEIWQTPTVDWYCIREVYEDGDFTTIGNGKIRDCQLWVDCMNYLLEKGEL